MADEAGATGLVRFIFTLPVSYTLAAKSASAVISPQTVELDGRRVELTAYNIGGANFFGLRELSPLFGYDVSFDEAANTARIESR